MNAIVKTSLENETGICRDAFMRLCDVARQSTAVTHLRGDGTLNIPDGALAKLARSDSGAALVLYQPDELTIRIGIRSADANGVEWFAEEASGMLAPVGNYDCDGVNEIMGLHLAR